MYNAYIVMYIVYFDFQTIGIALYSRTASIILPRNDGFTVKLLRRRYWYWHWNQWPELRYTIQGPVKVIYSFLVRLDRSISLTFMSLMSRQTVPLTGPMSMFKWGRNNRVNRHCFLIVNLDNPQRIFFVLN